MWAGPVDIGGVNQEVNQKHDPAWISDSLLGFSLTQYVGISLGPIPPHQINSGAGSKVGKQSEWLPPRSVTKVQGRGDGVLSCVVELR